MRENLIQFKRRVFRILLTLALTTLSQLAIADANLIPFKATYQAQARGHSFIGVQQLKESSPGNYEFSFKASTSGAKINENTLFTLKDNYIRPTSYKNSRKIAFIKRDTKSNFDWDKKIVDVNDKGKKAQLKIESDVLHSRLSYQLQIQLDVAAEKEQLEYDLVSKRSLRHYVFVKSADEIIETPLGKFNASVVEKVYDDKKDRATTIWLAKDYNFIIVKMDQREGKETSSLLLQSADLNGIAITGE